ncbi:hypothetical protein CLOM_g5464 [Closterium sp. NIES-68]|nr:hypothetical protein CLOM_g5464 [Closterium sp. NIES-68]
MVEFFFSHTDTARLGSSVVFEPDGALAASVVVEESLDTNDRRPQDWVSPTWGPGVTSSQLPDHLPPVPALDDKTMLGTRTMLTRNLMVQERENVSWAEEWSTNSAVAAATVSAAAAAAAAAEPDPAGEAAAGSSNAGLSAVEVAAAAVGFMGRVPEGDEHLYAVFALPQGVVMCAPRSLPLVAGRPVCAVGILGGGSGRGEADHCLLGGGWRLCAGGGGVLQESMKGATADAAGGREVACAVGVVGGGSGRGEADYCCVGG